MCTALRHFNWLNEAMRISQKTAISCEFFSQCISFNLESSEKEPRFCNSTFGRAFVFVLIFLFLTELILFFVEGFSKYMVFYLKKVGFL